MAKNIIASFHPLIVLLRGDVHTQTATVNVRLTFVGVWVKTADVRLVAEMSKMITFH